MSSCPERVKIAEAQLSQLPDDILCHILSLLPSKEAARTCVLSRRWRHLFLCVPKLIAQGVSIYDVDSDSDGIYNRDPEIDREMHNFINRWIMSYKEVSVNEFRLKTTYFPEEPVFYLWLTTLLSRHIKVLHLETEGFVGHEPTKSLYPPEGFFRSETLVALRIAGSAFILKVPGVICYPNLKTLHLEELQVVDESGQFRFVDASYPRLEELSLQSVNFIEDDARFEAIERKLTISLATLKKLVFDDDTCIMERVDIDTQHLEHLQFTVEPHDDMIVNFSRCESLVYADIYGFCPGESYVKFLSQLNNVKMLRLRDCDDSPEDYHGVAGSFPLFIHLTRLELREVALQTVWIMLHHAPNLEVLDFELFYEYEDFFPPEDVPLCLTQSLKEIRITGYKWYEDDRDDDEIGDFDGVVSSHAEIVQYFLQHGAVLQRMIIGHSKQKTAEWRQSTLNQYRTLDRLSQNCEIDVEDEEEY